MRNTRRLSCPTQEPISRSAGPGCSSRCAGTLSPSHAAHSLHRQGSSSITHKSRQVSETSYSSFINFTAVRGILSLVTRIKIEDEGLNEKQITVASVLPSSAGTIGIQGLSSAILEAWLLLSLAVQQSDTTAETDMDELMFGTAPASSLLLPESHSLPPMEAQKGCTLALLFETP